MSSQHASILGRIFSASSKAVAPSGSATSFIQLSASDKSTLERNGVLPEPASSGGNSCESSDEKVESPEEEDNDNSLPILKRIITEKSQQKNKLYLIQQQTDEFLYADTDLDKCEILESDFQRVLALAGNDLDIWERINEGDPAAAYVSRKGYKVGETGGLKLCRIDGEFDASPEEVLEATLTSKIRNEPALIECKLVDFISCLKQNQSENNATTTTGESIATSDSQYSIAVLQHLYNLPFPFCNRDFLMLSSVRKEEGRNAYIIVQRTITHYPTEVTVPNSIRAIALAGFLIEEISPNKTKYSNVAYMDYGGYVPLEMWKTRVALRATAGVQELMQVLKNKNRKLEPHPAEDAMMRTLRENTEYRKQHSLGVISKSSEAEPSTVSKQEVNVSQS